MSSTQAPAVQAQIKTRSSTTPWQGDLVFLLQQLILKDFRVRYRNMSLGVFWSLLNPLVMMGVLWFVFTKIMPNTSNPNFALSVLCGLVPFNFFTLGWLTSTVSLVENVNLVKRVTVPRELIPISTVLGNCLHLVIQLLLLIGLTLASGIGPNRHWVWLPYVWACEILFVCGLGLVFSALNVYVRDTRYVVESANTVLFWLVPIVYSFDIIPADLRGVYQMNPVAALVFAVRNILLEHSQPSASLLTKLSFISVGMFAGGLLAFRLLRKGIYDRL